MLWLKCRILAQLLENIGAEENTATVVQE